MMSNDDTELVGKIVATKFRIKALEDYKRYNEGSTSLEMQELLVWEKLYLETLMKRAKE